MSGELQIKPALGESLPPSTACCSPKPDTCIHGPRGKTLKYIKRSVAALVGLALAGCGGGGSSSPAANLGPPPIQAVSFTTGQSASVVIGQSNFTTGTGSTMASGISSPYGNPSILNGVLYLEDYGNNRVLGFNGIPTADGASADFVLGQTNFTTATSGSTMTTMSGPQTTVSYGGDLFVDEYSNNRIDVYIPAPTAASSTPMTVTPQPITFTLTATAAGGLNGPETVAVANGKLIVTDSNNNRVLIWNTVPTSDTPPNLILGQTSFAGIAANQTLAAPTAATLYYPAGVWTDGTRLVVLDENNHRVLIWNTFPTTNDQPADVVLGQPGFTTNLPNQSSVAGTPPTAATLRFPYDGVTSNGLQLFVTDNGNNRTLIWNTFPTTNDQPADVVLGQLNMTTFTAATSQTGEHSPDGLLLTGTQLLVADAHNNRYLVYSGQ